MSDKLRAAIVEKGYRYMVAPTDKSFAPLYVKTMADVCELLRELYPEKRFVITRL